MLKFCEYFLISALCELFDKADTGGDGTISIPEYVAMCDEYGIAIDEDHINSIKAIANENGEVSLDLIKHFCYISMHFLMQVRKNDFIYHIKSSNMYNLFESIDPESTTRWQNLAITAFK